MKKLSLLLLTAFIGGNSARVKAVKILFLSFIFGCISYTGYSQVTVTGATGGTNICFTTAVGSTAPGCTTLGDIVITETTPGDFSGPTATLELAPPPGWKFCTPLPTTSFSPGGDITSVASVSITGAGNLLISGINVNGVTLSDALRIIGLQVQPTNPTMPPIIGYITATVTTFNIAGINTGAPPTGTDFGQLRMIPGDIGGLSSHCVGDTEDYSPGMAPGGVWTSSNTTIATVDPTTGVTVFKASGSFTLGYNLLGCLKTKTINVTITPRSTLKAGGFPLTDMCAWFDHYPIYNRDSLTTFPYGFFSTGGTGGSGFVNIRPTGSGAGYGELYANAPGRNYIKFTLPSGCFVVDSITVNPLPSIISGNDTICALTTTTLSNLIPGGKWRSADTNIATIDSLSGVVFGKNSSSSQQIVRVSYVLPTGCPRDTLIVVNPLPAIITGTDTVCQGLPVVFSSTTIGGVWASSDTTVVKLVPFGSSTLVNPVGVGTAILTYTLSRTGCRIMDTVTVNTQPVAITANQSFECVGESIITLSDATAGGSWSTTATTVSVTPAGGVVTGLAAGTATISYTMVSGCYVTYVVTINPLPSPIGGDTILCVGSNGLLTNTSGPTGATPWGPSTAVLAVDPTTSGKITGLTPGTSIVTYTLSTGCYTTHVVTVVPVPDTIRGAKILCVGMTTTLTTLTGGVKWSSSNTTVASIDTATGDVIALAVGTSTISITLPTGCGNLAPFVITVTAPPTGAIGRSPICKGDTALFTDPGAFGGTWTINPADTNIATINPVTGIATGKDSGTVIITYTIITGCSSTGTLTVNPKRPIHGPTSFCQYDAITLTDSTLGGTFNSSDPDISFSLPTNTYPEATVVVTGITAGTAVITYSVASGCDVYYTVTVNPTPTVRVWKDSVCEGDTLKLYATFSTGGLAIGGKWTSDNTAIATIDSVTGTLTGVSAGTVLIIYTMPNGCRGYITIRVNTVPTPIVSPVPARLCQGYMITFGDALPGGLFSNKYTGVGTIDPNSGIYTAVGAGLDTIFYRLPTGCFVYDTVRVDPLFPIHGDTVVCAGFSDTLFNPTPLVGSGKWTSSNTLVAVIDSATGRYTGIDSGMAIITYTLPTGCFALDTVYVNPLPKIITGRDSVCVGSTTVFSDSTVPGLWTSTNPAIATIDPVTGVITGISAGTTTITYTLPTGCLTVDSVRVDPIPGGISGNSYVCYGFITTLSNPTTGGFWVSADPSVAVVDSFSGTVTSVNPGVTTINYILSATGCGVSITFTVFAPPNITVTVPGMICKGANTPLFASGADIGSILGSYTWVPATGLSSTAGSAVIASPTITTTYTVVGTTFYGCRDTATTIVTVDSLLNNLLIVGDDSICIGECAVLNASGRDGSLFAWTPTNGLLCSICDTTTACPTETTLYTATAIDRFGCKDSVRHLLVVMPIPVLSVYAAPHTFPIFLCRGTPLQLYAEGAWSYVWSPGLFLSCDSCANPIATDTFNMQYNLTGFTRFGCADSIKVKISVLDTNINTVSNDTDICKGDHIQLFATSKSRYSTLDIPKFQWFPDYDIVTPNIPNPEVGPGVTTVYTLVITENICFSDTLRVRVGVHPYPEVNIGPRLDSVYTGTSVRTTAVVTNTPIQSYVWTPGAGVSCDTCATTILTPAANTQYTVTVTSIYGCTSYDTVSVRIGCDPNQVYIPNTFTPNGDGMNDRFYISGKGLTTINRFSVYNRWGQLVYEVENINPNDPGAGWDGTFKGQVLAPDVFVYTIKATCSLGGEPFIYKGDISLVR